MMMKRIGMTIGLLLSMNISSCGNKNLSASYDTESSLVVEQLPDSDWHKLKSFDRTNLSQLAREDAAEAVKIITKVAKATFNHKYAKMFCLTSPFNGCLEHTTKRMAQFNLVIADQAKLKDRLKNMVPIDVVEGLFYSQINTNHGLANVERIEQFEMSHVSKEEKEQLQKDLRAELQKKVMDELKIDQIRYENIKTIYQQIYTALLND